MKCSDCRFWQTEECTNNPDGVDFNYVENFACFKRVDKDDIETAQQPFDSPRMTFWGRIRQLWQWKSKLRWGPIAVGTIVGTLIYVALSIMAAFSIKGMYWVDSSDLWGVSLLTIAFTFLLGGGIAGAMAGFRGGIHGMLVGLFMSILNLIVRIALGVISTPESGGIAPYIMGVIVGIMIVIGLSALGGLIGCWLQHKIGRAIRDDRGVDEEPGE